MKKALVIGAILLFMGTWPVFAYEAIHDVVGAKLDAPNLVGLKQISPDLHLGIEASKDLATNLFYPDSSAWIEDDLGFTGYVKLTYTGCFLNCSK